MGLPDLLLEAADKGLHDLLQRLLPLPAPSPEDLHLGEHPLPVGFPGLRLLLPADGLHEHRGLGDHHGIALLVGDGHRPLDGLLGRGSQLSQFGLRLAEFLFQSVELPLSVEVSIGYWLGWGLG